MNLTRQISAQSWDVVTDKKGRAIMKREKRFVKEYRRIKNMSSGVNREKNCVFVEKQEKRVAENYRTPQERKTRTKTTLT